LTPWHRLVAAALLAPLASCLAGPTTLNVFTGYRTLEDGAYDDVDPAPTYGAEIVVVSEERSRLDAGIEIGWLESSEDGGSAAPVEKVALDVTEYYGGLRFDLPELWVLQSYVSGGVSSVDVEFDSGSGRRFTDKGKWTPYARIGTSFPLFAIRIGVDVRYLFSKDLDLGPAADIDGLSATVFLSFQ